MYKWIIQNPSMSSIKYTCPLHVQEDDDEDDGGKEEFYDGDNPWAQEDTESWSQKLAMLQDTQIGTAPSVQVCVSVIFEKMPLYPLHICFCNTLHISGAY